MKILFLDRRGEGYVGAPQTRHEFEQEVSKHAECRFAGEGWPAYVAGESMDETVKRVMPDVDWVIDSDNNLHNKKPMKRRYKVGLFTSDLHGKHFYGVKSPVKFAEMINAAGYDAVFMRYLTVDATGHRPDVVYDRLIPQKYWVPWSVDIDKFRPRRPFRHDVTFLGAIHDVYPLRRLIWNDIYYVARGHRVLRESAPKGTTFNRDCEKLLDNHIVGDKYAEELGYTRILIFGCSKYLYPIQKFFEGSAAKCLIMSNTPRGAKHLGFIHGETMVDVDEHDWEDALLYCLENPKESAKIARNGQKNTLMKHSHRKRAEQWLEMLE